MTDELVGKKLKELLVNYDCRLLSYDNRWLVGSIREPHGVGYENYYVVYIKDYHHKYPRVLYEGTKLLTAMNYLIREEV